MKLNNKVKWAIASVCLILSFIITLQFKSVYKNTKIEYAQMQRLEDVQKELTKEKEKNIDLSKELLDANNTIQAYRTEAEKNNSGAKTMSAELDRLMILAGLTKVEGPGITVTVSDSKVNSNTVDNSAYLVHDKDLRSIINELNAAGAEAISLNGERIISTSEIRCVGPTVIVNNNKYAPPYVIKAIGSADTLEAALNIRGGIVEELEFYKLGVKITKSAKLTINKYDGIVNFTHAQKAED